MNYAVYTSILDGANPNDVIHWIQATSAHQFLIRNRFDAVKGKGVGGSFYISTELTNADRLVMVSRPTAHNGKIINEYMNNDFIVFNWDAIDGIYFFNEWALNKYKTDLPTSEEML